MPKLNILKRNGETTKQAVRRRMFDVPAMPQLPPARRVVQVAERILRDARR